MIVAVQGTNEFDDYNIFLRAMSVAMSGMAADDPEFVIYSVGPVRINSFVSEFSNLSERGMKARGKKIRFYKVTPQWITENMNVVDYFAFLARPNQQVSRLVSLAEAHDVEVGTFHF